jgi:hypothetical protein
MVEHQVSWIVKWNTRLYDVENRYTEGLTQIITIHQSKGRARMRIVPHVGNDVSIVWEGHIRMKGKVIQGFTAGLEHQNDNANIGNDRPHAEPEYYAILELRSVPHPIRIPFTGTRTWVKRNFDN